MRFLKSTLLIFILSMANFVYANCPHTPISPYKGHLNLISKYDPNDPTRSEPTTPDNESKHIQNHLNKYASYITKISDYYINNSNTQKKNIALACLDLWLDNWAEASALTSDDISHTGYTVRSWIVSTIASASYKVMKDKDSNWTPSNKTKAWLGSLVRNTINYYYPRPFLEPSKVNNHDYWAAWAAAMTGLLTSDRQLVDWSYTILSFSLDNVEVDAQTGLAYWKNEVGRGNLGLHYSHFALTPIVLLAITLSEEGYTIHHHQHETITQLSEFTAKLALSPKTLAHICQVEQKQIDSPLIYWSKIYNQKINNSDLVRELENSATTQIRPLPQLGGDISHIF